MLPLQLSVSLIWLVSMLIICNGVPQNLIEGVSPPNGVKYEKVPIRRVTLEDLHRAVNENSGREEDRKHENKEFLARALEESNEKFDKLTNILGSLKKQMDKLEKKILQIEKTTSKIADLKSRWLCKNEKPQKKEVEEEQHAKYEVEYCGNRTSNQRKYFLVDADHGSWEKHGFCQVFSPMTVSGQNYKVSGHLYNVIGPQGFDSGFLGLAYNIEDKHNFDFVYFRCSANRLYMEEENDLFSLCIKDGTLKIGDSTKNRLHRQSACFQTGFVQGGKIKWAGSRSGYCPEGPPKGRTWFEIEIWVRGTEANLYLNKLQVLVFRPHFPAVGHGGVIVAAGQRNIVRFKNLNITKIDPFPFSFHNCRSYSRVRHDYFTLDAIHGDWPDSGFCRAISKNVIEEKNYGVSASMFNQRASRGNPNSGVFGIVFNAQDQYNYDFVYLRPYSVGGCYTTGFVQNTVVHWVNSKIGTCPGSPLKETKWLNVTVNVREGDVIIELDSKHLVTTKAHFPSVARGGILAGNGLNNVISFKNYQVYPIKPFPFEFIGCTSKTRTSSSYFILDAKHGQWPHDNFCRAVSKKVLPGENYLLSANLFVQGPWRGEESNYAGLLYNAKDENNYDFVYVRPRHRGTCYQSGYVLNGAIQWRSLVDGYCPGGVPKVGTWFTVEISVRGPNAMIEIDGKHLTSLKPHFPVYARGGVIVGNGFKNVLTFRDYKTYMIKPFPFIIRSCGEGTHRSNGSFVLDGSTGQWPQGGFCRAISRDSVPGPSKYSVEAKFYNIDSFSGPDKGNLGLMFNVLDENNFEYVYIRPHNKDRCYQFGLVFNGVVNESGKNSGPCPGGPPKQGKWFRLCVNVNQNNEAKLQLDRKYVADYFSSLPWHGKGGTLVANGYRNVIMFRQFHQEVLHKKNIS